MQVTVAVSLNATAQVLFDPHVFDVVPKECATLVVPRVLQGLVPAGFDVITEGATASILDQVSSARSPICFVESGPSSLVPSSFTIREIRARLDLRAPSSPGGRTFTPLTGGFILSDVGGGAAGGGAQHLTYTPDEAPSSRGDRAYMECASRILSNGRPRQDRTGTGTIGVFGQQMRFDLRRDGFPLLTTKAVPFKAVIGELLWFVRGSTDATMLSDQGVRIWDGNTTREFLDARGLAHYPEGDIGPMYGWQWRHFGAEYVNCGTDYTGQGIDQLQAVIRDLKTDPYSRRIGMTAYNAADLEKGVLHPCHGIFVQFYVEGARLSCHMYQRSMDTFLGAPFNIASYAALTHLLAAICDMEPADLIISTGDTHIYKDHLDAMALQVSRVPFPQPRLKVNDRVKGIALEDITVEDFELSGYVHHPRIYGRMSV